MEIPRITCVRMALANELALCNWLDNACPKQHGDAWVENRVHKAKGKETRLRRSIDSSAVTLYGVSLTDLGDCPMFIEERCCLMLIHYVVQFRRCKFL